MDFHLSIYPLVLCENVCIQNGASKKKIWKTETFI